MKYSAHPYTSHGFLPAATLLRRDRWLVVVLFVLPVVLVVMLWSIFAQGIVRDLPIAVVDLSNSSLSRQLIRQYDASPTLAVTREYGNAQPAKQDLIDSEVYAYLVIPRDLDKQMRLGLSPQLTLFYNGQYLLMGRLVSSAAMQAQGTLNAQISVLQAMGHGHVTPAGAFGQAMPMQSQVTALFNLNSNYTIFLLGAIVPALWQVVMVAGTVLVLTAQMRLSNGSYLTAGSSAQCFCRIGRSLLWLWALYCAQGLLFLTWFFYGLDWPLHWQAGLGGLNHWLILIFAQVVTALVSIVMGALFYFLTLDAARAMSFAGAFSAPSFAFMGITFPVTNMGHFAIWWRDLLPITHYIDVQVSQINYAAPLMTALNHMKPMLGYIIAVIALLLLVDFQRQQQAKHAGQVEGVL